MVDPYGFFDTVENTLKWIRAAHEKLDRGEYFNLYTFYRVDTRTKTIYHASDTKKLLEERSDTPKSNQKK